MYVIYEWVLLQMYVIYERIHNILLNYSYNLYIWSRICVHGNNYCVCLVSPYGLSILM
uniref:Uncharacterized protein n=1 Tax=Anguilla anguilla TaxID=7936 RepID=A0A0E9V1Y7_ANGAN